MAWSGFSNSPTLRISIHVRRWAQSGDSVSKTLIKLIDTRKGVGAMLHLFARRAGLFGIPACGTVPVSSVRKFIQRGPAIHLLDHTRRCWTQVFLVTAVVIGIALSCAPRFLFELNGTRVRAKDNAHTASNGQPRWGTFMLIE